MNSGDTILNYVKKRDQSHFFTSDGRKTLERPGVPLCGTEMRNSRMEIRRLRK